jgi:hypothetical protein
VQSQSVDVGSPSFDDYLRSVAFLNAAHFPSMDFVALHVAGAQASCCGPRRRAYAHAAAIETRRAGAA